MSKQILIGLTGPAGCGKDTVAYLLHKHGAFHRYTMAKAMKQGLEVMLGVSMEIWDDRVAKETVIPWIGKSPRQLAQTLGTEWGRNLIHQDIWLRRMLREWDEVRTAVSPRMVVTDVRFDNEAQAIKSAGGTVWSRAARSRSRCCTRLREGDVVGTDRGRGEEYRLARPARSEHAALDSLPDEAIHQVIGSPKVMNEHTNRWNIEVTKEGVRICAGEHHRSQDCEWIEYVPKVWHDALAARLAAVEEALRLELLESNKVGLRLAEALTMLSERDFEYNRKTNALIERHAKQIEGLLARLAEAEALLKQMAAWRVAIECVAPELGGVSMTLARIDAFLAADSAPAQENEAHG